MRTPKNSFQRSAVGKLGRPAGPSKDERAALERDLMGPFHPDFPFNSYKPPQDEIKNFIDNIFFSRGEILSSEQAIFKLKERHQSSLALELNAARRNALLKLGFNNDQSTVPLNKFLQMLLPRVKKDQRFNRAIESIAKILPVYGKNFNLAATGWPKRRLVELLNVPIEDGHIRFAQSILRQCENGVSFADAMLWAPFIVSWNAIVSSPEMRGSMRQSSERPVKSPDA